MENNTTSLERLVAKHDAEIHAVNQRLGGIEHSLEDLKTYLQSSAKTNWELIVPLLSIGITILILAFAPLVYGYQMHQSRLEENSKILLEGVNILGRQDERLNALERSQFGQ